MAGFWIGFVAGFIAWLVIIGTLFRRWLKEKGR
jgi:hypothetical protein